MDTFLSFLYNKTFLKKLPQILLLIGIFFLTFSFPKSQLSETKPLLFFAGQCDDEIRLVFLKAIQRAKHSIVLKIYSLNDPVILKALEKKKKEGVEMAILIDPDNSIKNTSLPIVLKETSALMHQKILITDEEKVWIGSANFTSSSLRIHDNFVVALHSPLIAKNLIEEKGGTFDIKGQKIEIFLLPKQKKEAFETLISHLQNAKLFLNIAMFTWTHPIITEEVILANRRNVAVKVVIDENNAKGVSRKTVESLHQNKVPIKINTGSPMLHHKLALIDETTLIVGSANFTKAAFSKNDECILIIHDLNPKQRKFLKKLWKALNATSILPS